MTRIEQIRQREQVTGWGTFGELHADVTALLTLWDTRDAALRTLVEQWRKWAETADTVAADLMDEDGRIRKRTQAYYLNACADALDAILKETTP